MVFFHPSSIVRLLLGCHGLASDAARFRARRDGGPIGNPSCKLCKSGKEDPVHFLAACNALQAERQSFLSHAQLNLPDPAHDPIAFTEIMLGIDDLEVQAFLFQFITDLKASYTMTSRSIVQLLLFHPKTTPETISKGLKSQKISRRGMPPDPPSGRA